VSCNAGDKAQKSRARYLVFGKHCTLAFNVKAQVFALAANRNAAIDRNKAAGGLG